MLCNVSPRRMILGVNLSLRPQGSICPIRISVGLPASPALCECAFGFISLSKVFYTLPQKMNLVKAFRKIFDTEKIPRCALELVTAYEGKKSRLWRRDLLSFAVKIFYSKT